MAKKQSFQTQVANAAKSYANYRKDHPVITGVGASVVAPATGIYAPAANLAADIYNMFGNKDTKKTTYKSTNLQGYNDDALYSLYGGGTGSGGGGGGYSVAKADISGLLDAYEQQAATARQNAETKYANTRSDLLTSLKRFQEQNAQDVLNQKQSYLSEQSNLESARESANRQNRISAAARGIGGSGLQQLAQLQNLMGQSEDISQAAGNNQKAMDRLATLLREYEEDSDTKLRQNEEERTNTLNTIASNLANQRAQAIAENEQNYVNALNAARAQAAAARASGSSNNAAARQAANAASGALTLLTNNLNNELKSLKGMSSSKLKAYMKSNYGTATSNMNTIRNLIAKDYTSQLAQLQADYAFGADTSNIAQNNINALLNNFKYKK